MMKTLVFERTDTNQSTIVEQEIIQGQDFVDLAALLKQHYTKLEETNIQIYNPETNCYVQLLKVCQSCYKVPRSFIEPHFILFRGSLKRIEKTDIDAYRQMTIQVQEASNGLIQKKSGQRTIGEVLKIVKKQRNIHLHGRTIEGKRVNLQDAAKVIGVPRKSLDDYYCQLRVGEQLDFNFKDHIHYKMRVLRNYIKEQKPGKQLLKDQKNEKHPKELKVIKTVQTIPSHRIDINFYLEDVEPEYSLPLSQIIRQISLISEIQDEDNLQNKTIEELDEITFFNPETPHQKHIPRMRKDFFKDIEMPADDCLNPYYDLKGTEELRNNHLLFLD